MSKESTGLLDSPSTEVRKYVYELPEKPLVKVGPGKTRVSLGLLSLWHHRELIYFFTWRDIKVRYKQTFIGVAWAVLQPFLTMLVFALFFGRFVRIPSDGVPYPVFFYCGLLPWTFFANAITNSSLIIINNSNIINKVYFPRMSLPLGSIFAGLVDFLISTSILLLIAPYYGIEFSSRIAVIPLLMLQTTVLALGVGLLISGLIVKYRDIRHALPFCLQLWMFASPIIYPTSVLPESWQWLMKLNPMAGIIEGFRAAMTRPEIDWNGLLISFIISLLLFFLGAYFFRRCEKTFADFI
jgi:lipopolysaccharide transport system permease protein